MTTLKSFTLNGNLIEQVYYGGQEIRYRINGEEQNHDDFWNNPYIQMRYQFVIKKLNG
jgi:hypothetical protein